MPGRADLVLDNPNRYLALVRFRKNYLGLETSNHKNLKGTRYETSKFL